MKERRGGEGGRGTRKKGGGVHQWPGGGYLLLAALREVWVHNGWLQVVAASCLDTAATSEGLAAVAQRQPSGDCCQPAATQKPQF